MSSTFSPVRNQTIIKKIKKEEEVSVELIFNPITKKMMKKDSPTIQGLIEKRIIDNEGNILLTKEEMEEHIALIVAKRHIASNRIFDAFLGYLPTMKIEEVLLMIEACKDNLKSNSRVDDLELYKTKVKAENSEGERIISEIEKIRAPPFVLKSPTEKKKKTVLPTTVV